jgi:hypothetical protein
MSVEWEEIARVFDELFGKHADWLLSKYKKPYTNRFSGECVLPKWMPEKSNLLMWAKFRMLEHPELFSDDDLYFECYERRVSAGNESPPPGHWISIEEHGTAVLHTGSFFYLDCPFGGHYERIDPTYQSTRLPKVREKFDPTAINSTAARVANIKKQDSHRGSHE